MKNKLKLLFICKIYFLFTHSIFAQTYICKADDSIKKAGWVKVFIELLQLKKP